MSKGQETLTYLYSHRQKWAFLAVLFLVAASGYLDRNILPILFQPLKEEFGLSDRALGLLGGAPFALAFAVSSFPLAILADRIGRKPILVGALTLWTLMTALCGFAAGLPLLILGRMGVGLAEGGATPPAHALIAEYFPPYERGKAYGIHTTSSTAGALIAATAGGWIAAAYGWRFAFLGVALLSAPVCVLAQLVLREPRRGSSTPFKTGTFSINCRALFGKRSFVYIVVSLIAYSMLPYGVLLFMPTYLVRDMHVGLGLAGSIYGGAATLGTIIGTLSGGALSDRIARRSQRTLLQLSAAGMIVTLPLTLWALSVASLIWFFVLLAALVATLYAALPPTLAIVQAICGSQRRALAVAVIFVGLNSVGMTIAPLLTGIISDWLAPVWRSESLRLSMEFVSLALAPAAGLLLLASRHLRADFEA